MSQEPFLSRASRYACLGLAAVRAACIACAREADTACVARVPRPQEESLRPVGLEQAVGEGVSITAIANRCAMLYRHGTVTPLFDVVYAYKSICDMRNGRLVLPVRASRSQSTRHMSDRRIFCLHGRDPEMLHPYWGGVQKTVSGFRASSPGGPHANNPARDYGPTKGCNHLKRYGRVRIRGIGSRSIDRGSLALGWRVLAKDVWHAVSAVQRQRAFANCVVWRCSISHGRITRMVEDP